MLVSEKYRACTIIVGLRSWRRLRCLSLRRLDGNILVDLFESWPPIFLTCPTRKSQFELTGRVGRMTEAHGSLVHVMHATSCGASPRPVAYREVELYHSRAAKPDNKLAKNNNSDKMKSKMTKVLQLRSNDLPSLQ